MVNITSQGRGKSIIAEADCFLIVVAAVKGLFAVGKVSLPVYPQLRHQFSDISLRVFRVLIENLFTEVVSSAPLPVLKEHKGAFQQRCNIGCAPDNDRLLHSCLWLVRTCDFLDATYQILHKTELGHILRLQVGKLFRQIVRIHVPKCGNQDFFPATRLHKRQIPTPLVFHPDGVEVLRFCTEHNHDLGAVQRGEDIRFIGSTELVLQRNPGKENMKAFLYQLVVQIVGKNTVRCTSPCCVCLLIADEHIEGLFLLGDRENAFLDLIDGGCFFLIDCALIPIGMLQGRLVILIIEDRCELRPVYSGNAFMRSRILDIFNAVAAKHQRPVSLGVCRILVQNLLIQARSFVKFVVSAEMIGAVVQICPAAIIQPRQGLLCAAGIADAYGCPGFKFDRAPAHFTLEDGHNQTPL